LPLPTPLKLLGSPGSPYTRKMLATLRYKRLSYALIIGSHRLDLGLPKPKVELLPTLYLPDEDGVMQALVDSTPLIRRIDHEAPHRAVLPGDPVVAFLDYLLEDFADEWLTKAMFHYRWTFEADAAKASSILPRWVVEPSPEADVAGLATQFARRQMARLDVVGSNETTAPVIEASYGRILSLMRDHLETSAFLFGSRPSASDFAIYGQLTQLARFDPTPSAIALSAAPRVFAWVDMIEDLSGLEPIDGDWFARGAIPDTLRALFQEVGRVYAPVMIANAAAISRALEVVRTQVDGRPWVQRPFAYQARCLVWIREQFAALDVTSRAAVRDILDGTGCEALLADAL